MAKILVVDDDPTLGELVKEWLNFEKHTVTLVNTGFEGWKQIKTNEFDIAILDWDLPDINGIDILKQHRSNGGTTPVIMLTGRSSVDDKEAGLDSGASDYLTKPFHVKELGARIRAILRNQGAAAARPKPLGTGNEEVLNYANLNGTVLASRYEFLELIGEGGFAMVFKAKPPYLEKFVAIKMLQSTELSENTIARFEREAKALSLLDHPNIVAVHEFGVTENRHPYMVMEFVKGKSLYVALEEKGYLPLREGLDILIGVCDGLAHAHDMGILHRDIKPGNVMLKEIPGRPPVPKILDFGLAKLMEVDADKASQLTRTRQIFGSPLYMSPEQVRGKPVDERTDIYSMGLLIFEVLTGRHTHTGDNPVEIMFKHLEEPALTLQEACPAVAYPPELQSIVSKALEYSAEDRYQTIRGLKEDLETIKHTVNLNS